MKSFKTLYNSQTRLNPGLHMAFLWSMGPTSLHTWATTLGLGKRGMGA